MFIFTIKGGVMGIIVFLIGLIIGLIINTIIYKISYGFSIHINKNINFLAIFITGLVFLVSYLRFGLNLLFVKAVILASILIIVAFIDLKHQIIPDKIVIITLVTGMLFSFAGVISLSNAMLGMVLGGGILFLLALIPGALGGGDIKFMFALGSFLGANKTLYALFLAFILAACISLLLLVFKIKGRKDHIAFGPFLAFGSFFSFLLNI